MKEIELTQGKIALVDEADYEWLNQWKWCAMKCPNAWYAVRNSPRHNGKRQLILMHRVVMDARSGQQVDHKNRNGLDNQRHNLRLCTQSLNSANQKKRGGSSSQYKGVSWYKRDGKWRAQIQAYGKKIHLGYSDNEIEAAHAYDVAATKYFGEFARLNTVDNTDG